MKKPISATIDEALIAWIEQTCKDKARFRNKSHLIELALESMRNKEK